MTPGMRPIAGSRLEGTRAEILAILRRREGLSVDDLAKELGLAGATVRRHLDVLLRDNYVSVTQVRGGAGRPKYVFSLTEDGAELFPHHYVRLTHRLLESISALGREETAGRSGEEIADLVFEKMADRLAEEYGPRISGTTLDERVRSTVALIADEGLDFEVESSGGRLRLLGRGCPCTRMAHIDAGGGPRSCDHDRRMLERVLGVPVVALAPEDVPHEFLCGYLVRSGSPFEPSAAASNGDSA